MYFPLIIWSGDPRQLLTHTAQDKFFMHEKCGALNENGFIIEKINNNQNINKKKKSAISAQFWWKWDRLAVLFSRQILKFG